MSWYWAARLYFDRDNYGTEVLAKLLVRILNENGHQCHWSRHVNALTCSSCEIFYRRWEIVAALRRFAASGKDEFVVTTARLVAHAREAAVEKAVS